MKIHLISPQEQQSVDLDKAFDLAIRVTDDSGAPAADVPLSWLPGAGKSQWSSGVTRTDETGEARNTLNVRGFDHEGKLLIEVLTPEGERHFIGAIQGSSGSKASGAALIFSPNKPGVSPHVNNGVPDAGGDCKIIFTSQGGPSVPLYIPDLLTTQYGDCNSFPYLVECVTDSNEDLAHWFKTDVDMNARTVKITGIGSNKEISVTLFARGIGWLGGGATSPDITGNISLKFTTVQGQVPAGTALQAVSLYGGRLPFGGSQFSLLMANFTNLDGTLTTDPNWDGTITWSTRVYQGQTNTWLTTDPTPTDSRGMAINGVILNSTQFSPDGWQFYVATANGRNGTPIAQYLLSILFQSSATLPEAMSIDSGDGATLSLVTWHPLTVTYLDSNKKPVPNGTVVTWVGFPADRLTFDQIKTTTKSGKATNRVQASGGSAIPVAVISTTSINHNTCINDYGQLVLAFQGSDSIVVQPEEVQPLSLYATHMLDGIYTGDKLLHEVMWSADPNQNPDYTIKFDPNPSEVTGQQGDLKTTTQMTVAGPNKPTTITVYARSTDIDPKHFVWGNTPIAFQATSQVPQGRLIDLVSLDGNPLSELDSDGQTVAKQMLQATYTLLDGTPVGNWWLDWTVSDSSVSLAIPRGQTDAFGVTTNSVSTLSTASSLDFMVTVKAENTNPVDQNNLGLTFQSGDVQLSGQGTMDITSSYGSSLLINELYPLSVTYLDSNKKPMPDGTQVTWTGFPSDRLAFDQPMTQISGGKGIATNHIQATNGSSISDALVTTTHFNDTSGTYDHGDLSLTFKPKQQQQGVVGIMIDKPYCWSARPGHQVQPSDPTQRILCQVQVIGATGPQKVVLPTDPINSFVLIYTYTPLTGYQPLTTKTEEGLYYIMTDANTGLASFFVLLKQSYMFFTLSASWNNLPNPPSTQLVIGRNAGAGQLPPPTIPNLQNGTLPIPSSCPAPTFQVFIPVSSPIAGSLVVDGNALATGDSVALLLNDHVVWEGSVNPNMPVEVAYAALNLGAGGNILTYTTKTLQQSKPAGNGPFTVSGGSPQTDPPTCVERTLLAPTVVTQTPNQIEYCDILDKGLEIDLPAYTGVAENDMVTVYCYLSGQDALTSQQAHNIVPINYTVQRSSPLLQGKQVPVYLAQWYAAGYTDGQLKVDYKVTKATTVLWSNLLPTAFTLNTTFTLDDVQNNRVQCSSVKDRFFS